MFPSFFYVRVVPLAVLIERDGKWEKRMQIRVAFIALSKSATPVSSRTGLGVHDQEAETWVVVQPAVQLGLWNLSLTSTDVAEC